ncbi:MAG: hypothetical protein MJ248_07050, partial [Bacilli bacterium]|nr:hypothetical protein [Bacilli bacterium]
LSKAVSALAKEFDWLDDPADKGNTYVNNGYKDYTLLQALEPAENTYVADFALTQDERSISDYTEAGILHNFVPKDYASFGLAEKDTVPLKGIHFNKIFWTNKNFKNVTGKDLYNIWQVAGSSKDADHLSKVPFQSPITEQINMSFLLSCYAPAAQARIEKAYKEYYGKDWEASEKYATAGEQWVKEFLDTVNATDGRWHSSDGTAMKDTQLKDDWKAGYVYFGAYSKMKDAAGRGFAVPGQETDPILKDLVKEVKTPKYDAKGNEMKDENNNTVYEKVQGVCSMDTVQWDWEIEGFNGYFYTMDSQIVNNAKHPYMACLFARFLLDGDFYKSAIYSDKTPSVNAEGQKENGNQYGYYYPGEMPAYGTTTTKPTTNSYDWSKTQWIERSLTEDYTYLSKVKAMTVAYIQSLVKIH